MTRNGKRVGRIFILKDHYINGVLFSLTHPPKEWVDNCGNTCTLYGFPDHKAIAINNANVISSFANILQERNSTIEDMKESIRSFVNGEMEQIEEKLSTLSRVATKK